MKKKKLKKLIPGNLYKITSYTKNNIDYQSISICDRELYIESEGVTGYYMSDIIMLISNSGMTEEEDWFLYLQNKNIDVEEIKNQKEYQKKYPEYFI
jgi:hypothetical protein